MRCLIDVDILYYEVAALGQFVDEETGEVVMKPFDVVSKAFDEKVFEIEAECWATEDSLFFMTDNKQLYKKREDKKAKALKRAERKLEKNPLDDVAEMMTTLYQPSEYVPNFRDKVAKKKVYKGSRKSERPKHYINLVEYVCATRDVITATGCEADDLLSIHQCASEPLTTIICSRDKDLKIVPGMHFGWAAGLQKQFGPAQVYEEGTLDISTNGKKVEGTGLKFFYSQVLTGDKTDDYPGLPRCGPVKAYKILSECKGEEEMFNAVYEAYKSYYGDEQECSYASGPPKCHVEMNEQCQLAWMVQERDEDNNLVHYVMYDERNEE